MKRLPVSLGGAIFGLFVTWVCLYIASKINWPALAAPAQGCYEIDKCPTCWWTYPALFGTLLGPALLLGLVNAFAWRRWTLRRWAWSFGTLVLLTIVFHFAGHVLPLIR